MKHPNLNKDSRYGAGYRAGRSGEKGFTLVELLITIAILGTVVYSFSIMQSQVLSAASEDDKLTGAVKVAEKRMEESILTGASVQPLDWTAEGDCEWRRTVTSLRSSGENPTLVEVRIVVRRENVIICSLVTHIAE